MVKKERTEKINVITNIMSYHHIGILQQIEQKRLEEICRHFDIPITKENFAYCVSVKATFDGFLATMYGLSDLDPTIKDPDGIAYDLTAMALGLFKKSRKLPKKSKEILALFEEEMEGCPDVRKMP